MIKTLKPVYNFCVILFLLTLSTVSNNTSAIIVLKTVTVIYSLFLFKLTNKLNEIFSKSFYLYLTLIILAAISLVYSANLIYGALKLFNLLLNLVILFIFANYIGTLNYRNYILILKIIIIAVSFSLFIVLLFTPFDPSRSYSFELTRWSHVTFSRIYSIFYFIFLLNFVIGKNEKNAILSGVLVFLTFFQIYIANLRAATFGIVLFSAAILLTAYFSKSFNINKIKITGVLIIITILSIYLYPSSEYFTSRYLEPVNVFNNAVPQNSGVNARLTAYEKALKIITEKPIWGVGFGGFKNYKHDEFLNWINYPHNIILEFQVELGILGTIFFLFYCYKVISFLFNYNKYLLIIWLYVVWLALFAKDIPSNLFVFLPLIIYGRPYESDKLKEFFDPNKNPGVLPSNLSEISE